jgi:hypothetical protein
MKPYTSTETVFRWGLQNLPPSPLECRDLFQQGIVRKQITGGEGTIICVNSVINI